MAFRKRGIKDRNGVKITKAVTCSFCKRVEAFTTLHGGLLGYGGRTCCPNCYGGIKQAEDAKYANQSNHKTEADYQIERWYGI